MHTITSECVLLRVLFLLFSFLLLYFCTIFLLNKQMWCGSILFLYFYFQIDDYGLVRFLPLDVTDEESIDNILLQIDAALQYGKDQEPKEPKV